MLAATSAAAEPNVALYQLQERCAKRADEVLRQDQDRAHDFQIHYNARLNKCLLIERWSSATSRTLLLFDVNENKECGSYIYRYKEGRTMWCSGRKRIATRKPSGTNL